MDFSSNISNASMEKITDKYHQSIQPDKQQLNPLFDIKQVPKRIYQLGLTALLTGIGLSCYDAIIGMLVSSFLVACFCFSILMFMLLKYNDAIEDLTISIISLICALLIFSACLEGLQSEQYLYFFPVLIAVPLIIDLKQTQNKKSIIFISIIIFSFIVCICIGRYVTPMESFTDQQISRLALANRITAIGSTIVLAALYTFFEKKYIQELVEQSNRVINTKTQFLATMGHELRTPLNGIVGIVNLLKKEPDTDKQKEYIQILQSCSDHMLQQVNDILDFNKIEAGNLELHLVEVNLKQLILNTAMPFMALSHEKKIKIIVETAPELDVFVLADDLRLQQVFNNLFANAMKFTNSGYIKLKAAFRKKDKHTIALTFSMEDTGIGIEKADQGKIFDSFWQVYDEQTKQLTGTGLGLTICIRLLKLMGSTLSLESEKGKGSKFSFDLVLGFAQKPVKAKKVVKGDLSGVRILLVEDNKINMMVAQKILKGYNAEVAGAFDGQEALESIANDPPYQVVIMDLEMPVMNGYTAIYEIRKLYPYLPVIALTASLVDEQMLADLLTSGFNDCMLKPFKPEELLSRVKNRLQIHKHA